MNRPITYCEKKALAALLAFYDAPNKVTDPGFLAAEAELHRCIDKLKKERAAPALEHETEGLEGV